MKFLLETSHGVGISRVLHLVLSICDRLDRILGDWKLVDSQAAFGQIQGDRSSDETPGVVGDE